MKYNISKDGVELTEADLELINKKWERLQKLLESHAVADIRLRRDPHHAKGEVITCVVNIEQGKDVFHAERNGEKVQDALDAAITALKQQLNKTRDKKANTR